MKFIALSVLFALTFSASVFANVAVKKTNHFQDVTDKTESLTQAGEKPLVVIDINKKTLPASQSRDAYFTTSRAELKHKLQDQINVAHAKNVVLFIGDGMSIPTLTAARIYAGQKLGLDGESYQPAFERLLPYSALSKTYTNDSQVADSAPTATAMVTGVKSNNGTLGVDWHVQRGDCAMQKQGHELKTLFELAKEAGMAAGVITTTRITHATPAAAYAKLAERNWESDNNLNKSAQQYGCKDAAVQLIEWMPSSQGFEVMFGGGRRSFMPTDQADPEYSQKKGRRQDGRNLIMEWQQQHPDGVYVWNKAQFDAVDPARVNRVLGLFEPSHMNYEADRAKDVAGEPSLAEMSAKAVDILSKNPEGFILMIEGGRIDHAHHANNAARALIDTVAFDDALRAVYEKVDPKETLIIFTADHSHTFSIAGYPKRNNPILGIAGVGDDKKPYTTLGYANGPGGEIKGPRADLTKVDTTDLDYVQQTLVPLGASETHAGDDVAILAQGPWAYLFHGVVEENFIYQVMEQATNLEYRAALGMEH